MAAEYTNKQKNKILKEVLKKTHQNYEKAHRKQEHADAEVFLEKEFKKLLES